MLRKIIIGTTCALAFSANAFALTGQGAFKKKSQKIKGAWALVEYQDKQVLAFHKKFDAQTDARITLVLSKQKVRKIENTPTFVEPLMIGAIEANKGDQNFVLPASINLKDYKSLVLFDEAANLVIAGFDIPRERSNSAYSSDLRKYNNNSGRDIARGVGFGS